MPRQSNAEITVPSTLPPPLTDGDLLVRLPASGREVLGTLPPVPDPSVLLTVTLGHPRLLPDSTAALLQAGYRIVGVATEGRPIGPTLDVFVPESLRREHPVWWAAILERSERVFDLRLGPVQLVLAAELELHTRGQAG